MFNIHPFIAELPPSAWAIIACCLLAWIAVTYGMGQLSEKHWGDRESGALIGFFGLGLLFTLTLYLLI